MDVSTGAEVEAVLLAEDWDTLGSIADRLLRDEMKTSHMKPSTTTLWILVQIMLENYSLASSFAQQLGLPTNTSPSDEILVVELAHACAKGKFSAAFETLKNLAFVDPLLAQMVPHLIGTFQTHILSVHAHMGAVLSEAQLFLSIEWEGTLEDLVVFVGRRGWKLVEGYFTYTPREDSVTKKEIC
eukprot:TRINITY_DN3150_c0_g2_i1.p1 TRINITY_DN3150_c0_g2~~TRINITY_DN3150_c0_g2_i1.p1  ORF type:complete len:185 (+),score=42.54 TRINITY_DN3150_c0_g2_i1:135-689(+)